KWAFLYSLIIRCSFHTYQGLISALGLGLILGTIFYLLYQKIKPKNLLPFFLAHAVADVIGLTILSYILY
ncbi:type II CAAX prenyl endopeptidase Rce1 family protein, partial [Streptococcus suis]